MSPQDFHPKSCTVSWFAFKSVLCMCVFCMYVCVHMCVHTSVCRCSSYMHELEATVIVRCLSLLPSVFFGHRVSYWSWNSPVQLGFLGSELLASLVSNSPVLGLQVFITVLSFGCGWWGSELKASSLHLRTLYTMAPPQPLWCILVICVC